MKAIKRERRWLVALFALLFTCGVWQFLQVHDFGNSTVSRMELGLWRGSKKVSHDDYDSRLGENAAYLLKVNVKSRRRFYIYPWDEAIVNRWPVQFLHKRPSILPIFALNHGLGPVVNAAQGRYLTHQYSLFRPFLERLKHSPLRTLNASEASLFFIPYDLGMDSSSRQSDGALTRTNCPMKPAVSRLLAASPTFRARHGHDHFVLHTINQMMLHYSYIDGCMDLYKQCFNCTKLSIDAYGPELYSVLGEMPFMRHRWVSIPFPSDFHMSAEVTEPLWAWGGKEARVGETHDRPILIVYVGSDQVTSSKQKALRIAIRQNCHPTAWSEGANESESESESEGKEKLKACVAVSLGSHESHALLNGTQQPEPTTPDNGIYQKSRLCLMPGGDFPTRKAFFDALLSGCVPVIFQPASALTQWPWHWIERGGASEAEDTARACVVYYPWVAFMKDVRGAMRQLSRMATNSTFLSEKRSCIASVAMRMQYSAPHLAPYAPSPRHLHGVAEDQTLLDKDAVDVVLDRLFLQP